MEQGDSMGYLFLFVALLAGATKGYCGKKTSGYTTGFHSAVFANCIRMLLCTVIGLVLVLVSEDTGSLIPRGDLLLISAFSGITTAIFVVTWLVCVRKSAYMMLDIFLMLGVLIPLIASSLFFDESVKPTQWIGVAVLFAAVMIMCSYHNTIKEKLTPGAWILLLICGTASGFADFSQKLFVKLIPDGSAAVFNFYTYLFAAVVLLTTFAATSRTSSPSEKPDYKKILGYILVMAICLFANSFFKTLAAGYLHAVILYPLNQGCGLILSAVMSSILFQEKLTAKAIIGILVAFAGLLIINLI